MLQPQGSRLTSCRRLCLSKCAARRAKRRGRSRTGLRARAWRLGWCGLCTWQRSDACAGAVRATLVRGRWLASWAQTWARRWRRRVRSVGTRRVRSRGIRRRTFASRGMAASRGVAGIATAARARAVMVSVLRARWGIPGWRGLRGCWTE